MVEYPIIEEKILTGEPEERPEYRVLRKKASAQSKPHTEKSTLPKTLKELTPKEKYEKMRDAFLRIGKILLEIDYPRLMKMKDTQLNTGIDPEILTAGINLAGFYIEGGARSFVDFSQKMIADIGEGIRPYLKSLYTAVRNYPGLDNTGMNTEAELEAININEIDLENAPRRSLCK